MSIVIARKRRNSLYFSIVGLVLMAAAVTAISARDPSGVGMRAGMVMLTAGAAFLLPWQYALPAAIAIWLGPNYLRSVMDEEALFSTNMLLELPALLGLSAFSVAVGSAVEMLEAENLAIGSMGDGSLDSEMGVYEERSLRPALEAELTRSHRFERPFALVLVGIDDKHARFDYRDEETWTDSFRATALLLRRTRNHIDRVYRYGPSGFALILPESADKEVTGLVRRLRKIALSSKPREGEAGGPLPVAFGATFFPSRASTVEDLMRRAEIALRVAGKNPDRMQLDGAEAPAMAPPETMRQLDGVGVGDSSIPSAEEDGLNAPIPLPVNISDAYIAARTDRPAVTPTPISFDLVPTTALVETVLVETGQAPEPVAIQQPAAIAEQVPQPEMADEELAQLLGRLDETLGLIRGLRAQAS